MTCAEEVEQDNYRKMRERYLTDYYNRHKPFDRGRVIGLETWDRLPLDKDCKYKFHIRIDRLVDMGNGVYEVHDYKTNSALPKQEEFDEHKREAEEKLEKLKEALITFCQRKGVLVVFGSDNKISVKEYESIKLPGKNTKEREALIEVLRSIDKMGEVSELDVYGLTKVLKSKEWDEGELEQLSKFWETEKSYRLSVSKK